jgi:hypothetical protein
VIELPFDQSLPSPISDVLQLRASSQSSVVEGDRSLTLVQERMRVRTTLEERIAGAGANGGYALVLVTGSAGGGKSLVVNNLAARDRALFAAVVEDATHSDAPDQQQYQRLVRILAPLGDRQPAYTAKPILLAMNTGMVIRFFDQLRASSGQDHGFINLEAEVRRGLGLVMPNFPSQPADPPGRVLVVNLDYRPTSGSVGSLFRSMARILEPDKPGGIMDTRRCTTCKVTAYCFVRTNAFLVSSDRVAEAFDTELDRLALERSRAVQPRALWDVLADLVTGGEAFEGPDPCLRIAELADAPDGPITVWRRLVFNGPFAAASAVAKPIRRARRPAILPRAPESRIGLTGRQLASLDISFLPSRKVHEVLSQIGINPDSDAAALVDAFEADLPNAAAIPVAAAGLAAGLTSSVISREHAGRGVVRAFWLAGRIHAERDDGAFRAALAHVVFDADREELERVRTEIVRGLETTFGKQAGGIAYFRTEAYEPMRKWAVYANVDLDADYLFLSQPFDRPTQTNRAGAELVGYEPLALTFTVAGKADLTVNLPIYRLLRMASAGTLPSSADLERFYQLRRAAEILGQAASQDPQRRLLLDERDSERKYQIYRRGTALAARPIS